MIRNLIELLEVNRKEDRGIIFILNNQDFFFSYEKLYQEARLFLGKLQKSGLKPGNELIFQLEDNQQFLTVFWGCVMGGIIPVPVSIGNNEAHRLKLLKIWKILNNPYLITDDNILNTLNKLEDINMEDDGLQCQIEEMKQRTLLINGLGDGEEQGVLYSVDPDDIAFIQFSSGSTGEPKGVILTHRNLLVNIADIVKFSGTGKEDSTLGWMPLTHDMGLIGFHLSPLSIGINQYIMPTATFIMSPIKWMEKTIEYKITTLASPNFGYQHFLSMLRDKEYDHWDLSFIRLILNGAEPISAELSNKFYGHMAKWGLKKEVAFPVYGLAEACLAVSFPKIGDDFVAVTLDRDRIAIGEKIVFLEDGDEKGITFVELGYPVENCHVKIRDNEGNDLQEEVVGHVLIKGDNVTAGYYNNKEATEKTFTSDGWLITGDLGFMRKGKLVITGRAKDIIFVNGQNYYPHDLEGIAGEIDGAQLGRTAICGVFNQHKQKEDIIVFVLFKKNVKDFVPLAAKLKRHLNQATGLEIAHVLPIRTMPKTTSGKVQRFKLKEEFDQGLFTEIIAEMEPLLQEEMENRIIDLPTNELEEALVGIWSEVLGVKKIGINDSFFELGGDSLKATYVASKIYKELSVEVQLQKLFETPTIKALAEMVSRVEKKEYIPINRAVEAEYYPLSSPQKRMFTLNQVDTDSTNYNVTEGVLLEGQLCIKTLEAAIKEVIHRHEVFRTTFDVINEEPVQKINKDIPFELEMVEAPEEKLETAIKEMVKPFDLRKGPLFKMLLIKTSETRYYLVFDAHHIIFDGTSMGILLEEIIKLYRGGELMPPTIQYKDVVIWQLQQLEVLDLKPQENFWLQAYKGELPVLNLPTDHPRPPLQTFEGEEISFKANRQITSRIKELALRQGASLQMILLASYYVLLSKYTGQEDLVVGIPTVGRNHPDLDHVIGMFVNSLPLRNRLKGDQSFNGFVEDLKNNTLRAYENQDYQFEMLLERLDLTRDMSRNPLFDTMFVMQNMNIPTVKEGDFTLSPYRIKKETSKFDLTLFSREEMGEIDFVFEYSTRLFNEETIHKMKEHYLNILNEIVESPEKEIASINMLSQEEWQRVVYDLNNRDAEYPKEYTLGQLFEKQVEKNPDGVALSQGNEKITYRELNEQANQLARLLRTLGVGPNIPVAIVATRSPQLIVAIMATLKAGGGYIPIDPEYPEDRIKYILEDSNASILLTESNYLDKIKFEGKTIDLMAKENYLGEAGNLGAMNGPEDLAYIIYTSGSTGNPKGVMLEHRGVVNYITWAIKSYVKDEKLNFPLYTTISFDLTVTSVFAPLLSGNSIILYGEDTDELLIEKVLRENKVGVLKLTPSHIKLIKDKDNRNCSIRRFVVGGEQLTTTLARELYESFGGNVEIYNEYGPTEASVGCMIYRYDPKVDCREAVSIGVPGDNVKIYLLDQYMNPVPDHVVGEMYISGDGIARGYVNKPELTEERFLLNPFVAGERMYKTGDLARRLSDGNIEYIGRIDHQVKVRGYRIEIGEIESSLMKHEDIKEAIVIPLDDEAGNTNLWGYIVGNREFSVMEIREFLLKDLPSYMVPAYFVQLEEFPLTINGKVDRNALIRFDDRIQEKTEFQEPISEVQGRMAEVFSQILGVEKVGITDNYFALGGDSIKAIQIVSRLSQSGISMNVKDILTYQTIAEICQKVDLSPKKKEYQQGIVEGNIGLLPIHNWYFSHGFNNIHYYNQSAILELKKSIDVSDLEKAFTEIIRHHDGIRLNYDSKNNQLFFNPKHLNSTFKLETFDLTSIPLVEKDSALKEMGGKLKGSFDINEGLLFKAALVKFSDQTEYLVMTAHHIIIDGVSWRIIFEDLYQVLATVIGEKEIKWPSKTASLKDWQEGLVAYSNGTDLKEAYGYWDKVIQNNFLLPLDYDTEDWSISHSKTIHRELSKEATELLIKDANRSFNTQVNDLLLVALGKSIMDWTGESLLQMEMEDHGRHLEDVDVNRTIGWFTNIYPLQLEISKKETGDQIKSVKEQLRQVAKYSFDYQVLKHLKGQWQDTPIKISEMRFNYLGRFDGEIENDLFTFAFKETGAETCGSNKVTTKLDLNCLIVKDQLRVEITYNTKAHREETIQSFAENYMKYIVEVIEYAIGVDDVHFTPSDFEALDIGQDDLDSLFM